jgi:hypothetical protein
LLHREQHGEEINSTDFQHVGQKAESVYKKDKHFMHLKGNINARKALKIFFILQLLII